VAGGNGAYFMGQVSSHAFKAYFPTVFLIKEPIPTLFFIFFALGLALSKIFRSVFSDFKNILKNIAHYLRVNILEFSMSAFVALYAYLSITGNLNIGFRHLFPILPFIFILTAKNIFIFIEKRKVAHSELPTNLHDIHQHRISHAPIIFPVIIISLTIYLVLGTIAAYPSYMSYFNETVGGSKNGYHFVTDSNADWGQDLKRLRGFLDSHPDIGKIHVDYFGGGDIKTYLGDKYLMWWDSKRPVEPGWYAVSTNFLEGSLYDTTKPAIESYRWLENKNPLYQAGTSILIYYVTPEEARLPK
jgi:hypothetical protein